MVDGGKEGAEPPQTLSPGGDYPFNKDRHRPAPAHGQPHRAPRHTGFSLWVTSQRLEAGTKGPPTIPAHPIPQVSPLPYCLHLPGETPQTLLPQEEVQAAGGGKSSGTRF